MVGTKNRPVFLNLIKIKLPIAGVMSILHRVSGVMMFLAIPGTLFLLQLSLQNQEGFNLARELLGHPLLLTLQFILVWSIMHHLLAGIRFLLLDIHIGVDKPVFRYTAWTVTLLAPLLSVLLLVVLL